MLCKVKTCLKASGDKNISPYTAEKKYVLEQGSVDEIISLFNSVLAALAYDKYPVKDETVLRAMLRFRNR